MDNEVNKKNKILVDFFDGPGFWHNRRSASESDWDGQFSNSFEAWQ
jgi:hypothetical protein